MYNVRPWYVVFDHRGHQRESMADASCQQSAPKSVDALSAPGLNHSLLFQVHVGIAKARRGQHITAKQHCCEVCRSMDQCVHWNVVSGSKEKGSKGTCALYGSRVATLTPAATSPTIETAVLLLRSDVQKLQTLTRCHVEIVRWLQSQLVGEAELELLVDATALASTAAISRARDQLRAALHAPAFLYTAEELERTFPAVRQWPSPAHHDPSRNRLKGDAVRLWWAKVLKLQRPALGPRVAQRLISYLIHEPSIVLWARRRAEAARLRDGGAPPAASSGGRLRDESALPRYTWVIEDDAVFVGDLRGFLRLFRPPRLQHLQHLQPLPPPLLSLPFLHPLLPQRQSREGRGGIRAATHKEEAPISSRRLPTWRGTGSRRRRTIGRSTARLRTPLATDACTSGSTSRASLLVSSGSSTISSR